MKTLLKYSLALLAGLSVALSCSKMGTVDANDGENAAPAGKQIIIHATLADAPTRVEYTLDESGEKPKLTLKWETTDALLVSNASGSVEIGNPTIDATGKTATFSGTLPEGGEPYTVVVQHAGANLGATQTQAADGDLKHLEYAAMAEGVTEADFENLALTQTTGVLGLIAKIPTVVSAAVKAVIFQTESTLFNGSNTLTVNLGTPGAGIDNLLYVYANVATASIPAGTEMFIRFKVGDGENDYYTRYQVFASDVSLNTGALNGLKLNCTHIDRFAGKDDKGTAAAPYLIADGHQLAAANGQATGGSTTFFKLIDDVDMTGISHNHINTNSGYTQVVDFDGNDKAISHLGTDLFYVLKGSVYDVTLDQSTVTQRGILAEYVQGSGNVVRNVTVCNGSVKSKSDNVGGLIGAINNGTTGQTAITITDCSVSNTSVSGAGVVGGIVGYVNEVAIISGCSYSGGTVTATKRYCGGAIGSIGEFAAVVSDCHVEKATVTSSSDRIGGFIGQVQKQALIKGCTVGSSTQRVLLESTLQSATVNAGGFAGVNYGTITKNGDVRNKAYVHITGTNSTGNTNINIGGFVGYLEAGSGPIGGVVEYADADVDMSSLVGQQVGGFVGFMANRPATVDHCTSTGNIKGNNYTGGFIGNTGAYNHTVTNNSSSGTVSGAATVGGFVGQASKGTWTNNTTTCSVSGSGANIGGFAGQINGDVTVSKCSSQGTSVSASGNVCGGFAAIAANGAKISDSFSVTNLLGGTRKRGGMIGHVSAGEVSMNRCYATGSINANFELGGIVGTVAVSTFSMKNCAAWNGSITAGNHASDNWSSASIVGVADLNCTLTDNYRNPNMALTAYWGTVGYDVELISSFQQPNVSSTSPLTDWTGATVTSGTMRPYNGKCETGKTLSQLASSTLGWSSEVWDFSGDLPVLK